jgi:hypothetical protein
MPRRSRNTEELRKAAVHVNYEIEMLVFAAEHLGGWHSSPMTNPVGNEKHMALESFLLHFRNLRAFLCPSLQRQDDVLASDFLGLYDRSDKLNLDKERLDKMLAHVSYSRSDYIEADHYRWDSSAMLILMLSELQKFLVRLPDEQRGWFPSAELLEKRQQWAQAEVDQRGSTKSGL